MNKEETTFEDMKPRRNIYNKGKSKGVTDPLMKRRKSHYKKLQEEFDDEAAEEELEIYEKDDDAWG